MMHFATVGRRTGLRHEKWWLPFAPDGDTLYLVEEIGDRADWVRNALAAGRVEVWGKNGDEVVATTPRVVTDADELRRARGLLRARFGGGEWGFIADGFVVALDAP